MAANLTAGPDIIGQWGVQFNLQNVAIHAHLLPTGKVLYWGRRREVGSDQFDTLNEHSCLTFLWDPVTRDDRATAQQPQLSSNDGVNLFCSGHSFLPDGRLLVAGGHLFDSVGVDQACIYDPTQDTWVAQPRMNGGRWYPSALTLPDGGVFVISGSFAAGYQQPPPDNTVAPPGPFFPVNMNPQIWRNGNWVGTTDFDDQPLYPRLHIEPKQGHIFMAGPQGRSDFLDLGTGIWTPGPTRFAQLREYAPSVMYESGKLIFIGGGLDETTQVPTKIAEIIDLNDAEPEWSQTKPMHFRRRQHNATVLPDGSVLVTGGTKNLDVQPPDWHAFDDLRSGAPEHQAELWDPRTKEWTVMAAESVDRCYHSTALLLPDGRVLSAGGGEYDPKDTSNPNLNQTNPQADSHQDAQVFSPPYLFRAGSRPTIVKFPPEISYTQQFSVVVGDNDTIKRVSWIRLGSVTHSCNMNQSCIFLDSNQAESNLTVTAPLNANISPPGHYMLFVLNEIEVPSEARIIRIQAPAAPMFRTQRLFARAPATVDIMKINRKIITDERRPHVVVGVSPSCPYGLGACWGGALGGLKRLQNVKVVRPVPDTANSLAFVYLKDDTLPELDTWRKEFAGVVNGTYIMRGIEMTIPGLITVHNNRLTLRGTATRQGLRLAPLKAADKVQWDIKTRANRLTSDLEASAFDRLATVLVDRPAGMVVKVTGPLVKNGEDFVLQVREFEIIEKSFVQRFQGFVKGMMAWLANLSCFP